MATLLLLGVAQDAGVPQIGCTCPNCEAAWAGATGAGGAWGPQWAVSAALVDEASRRVWLLDCGPDIKQQWHMLQQRVPGFQLQGVLLTHCHMGHVIGLIQLGKEGCNIQGLTVAGSASVCRFLRDNQPYATGVRDGNFVLRELTPHEPLELSPALTVVPIPVPHRAEYSDCVAFQCSGPARRALWLPDIDSWEAWDAMQGAAAQRYGALRAAVAAVDHAFLDACFFDSDELPPGRDPSTIPHPRVLDTLAALEGQGLEGRVVLIHMNHTNPLWRPQGAQAQRVLAAGLAIGQQGGEYRL